MQAVAASEAPIAHAWRRAAWVGAVAAAVLLGALLAQPAWRFGDGAEYYALYLAMVEHGRPWMTEAAWQDYARFVGESGIASMVPPEMLRGAFPSLVVGATADFNHFWAYSACAAVIGGLSRVVGLDLSPHAAFMTLHALVFGSAIAAAWRYHGPRGATIAALLVLGSPVLWFAAKVHTEFLTVCLVLLSCILLAARRWYTAALPLALASTQNISLAATVVVICAFAVVRTHLDGRRPSPREMATIAAAGALCVLHPLYYLLRQGVITPQLKAGGAEVGGHASQFLAVLVDPDIGLFPNWWLGALLFAAVVVAAIATRKRPTFAITVVALVYLVTNLFAQASTINLNSGSVDLSRYALWYVPLLYAPLAWLFSLRAQRTTMRVAAVACATLALPLLAWTINWYWPARYERYTTPSMVSAWLQTHIPRAYDPAPEIFVERNSGFGEANAPLAAVAGPACRKLYIPRELRTAAQIPVISSHRCTFDPVKVAALSRKHPGNEGTYIALDQPTYEALQRSWRQGDTVAFGKDAPGANALADGWSSAEAWGAWSNATVARVRIRVEGCTDAMHVALHARGFVPTPSSKVDARVFAGEQHLGDLHFDATTPETTATWRLPCSALRTDKRDVLALRFEINGAARPSDLALGPDQRLLGIGIDWLALAPASP